jgi:spore maturation protein CgeB
MNILYIGQYNEGSTSAMRGNYINKILKPSNFTIINIDFPLNNTNRVFRSLGWRFKFGPLIKNVNKYIFEIVNNNWSYDLVWIDKGVFILPSTIKRLRISSKYIIHFTPDPAFMYHRSKLFYKSIQYYDICVTTKSFEKNAYLLAGAKKLILTTQGFHDELHKPYHNFNQKNGIIFIGHHEKDREEILIALLSEKYHITLAGIGWAKFAKKNKNNYNLNYLGDGIFGTEYAKLISGSFLALGFLSKIIPELHTTRTIEIPACGTALVTERNVDTRNIFTDDEVYFFSTKDELLFKVKEAFADINKLQTVSENGMKKIRNNGYDYKNIIKKIINDLNFD